MKPFIRLAVPLVLLALLTACSKREGYEPFWVVSQKMDVFASATKGNDVIKTLQFGDEVQGREPNLGSWVPKRWLEIRVDNGRGYVDRTNLADKATIDAMQALIEGVKDRQIQAVAETFRKTPLRLGPSLSAPLIELLKDPARIEIFERAVVESEAKGKTGRSVWYKVRLEDGRVGFIPDRFRLVPPVELNPYTAVRRAVAWHELREREGPKGGEGCKDYIVAYASDGSPIEIDFTRVELYTCDPMTKRYGTTLAKSALSGKLPLTVQDADAGGKIIEIRQAVKEKPGELLVQEYSFPDPVKLVREYELDQSR